MALGPQTAQPPKPSRTGRGGWFRGGPGQGTSLVGIGGRRGGERWELVLRPRRPSPSSLAAASPPPAPAALSRALGRLAPPLPPAQPKGRSRPQGAPEVAGTGSAEGTAPAQAGQLLQWGWGQQQTLRAPWKEGAFHLPTPQRLSAQHSTPIVLWCPALQPPSFCSRCMSSWMPSPILPIGTHVPFTQLHPTWTLGSAQGFPPPESLS